MVASPKNTTPKRFLAPTALIVAGLVGLLLFLVEETGPKPSPAKTRERAFAAFEDLGRTLRQELDRGASRKDPPWPRGDTPEASRLRFTRLRELLPAFPQGTTLEILGPDDAPWAWAGPLLAEDDEAKTNRRELRGRGAGPLAGRFGIVLFLGYASPLPGTDPELRLAAWHPLDLLHPSFRPFFSPDSFARTLEADLGCEAHFRISGSPEDGALATASRTLHAVKSTGIGPVRLDVRPKDQGSPSRPGPLVSVLWGISALLLFLMLARRLLLPSREGSGLRFAVLLLLLGALRASWWAVAFPTRILPGASFDPEVFGVPLLPGVRETAGGFLITAVFATAAVAAFLRLALPPLQRLVERSRTAASVAVVALPLSVPLLTLLLVEGIGALVDRSPLGAPAARSVVDLHPAGRSLLSLPATFLLLGFFLFALCFALLGTSFLHTLFRALRKAGEKRAAMLVPLAGAAASVIVLWPFADLQVPIVVPAAVLILLHPVHLRLRHEGVTALHTGVFLLAASAAVFPPLRGEIRRSKRVHVEALMRQTIQNRKGLKARMNETMTLASGTWHESAPRDAPYLPFLFWSRSGLNLPGLSTRVYTRDKKREGLQSFVFGDVPDVESKAPLRFLTLRPGRIETFDTREGSGWIARERSPAGITTTMAISRDWPRKRPSFPLAGASSSGLAFARYEGGQLASATQPGFPAGRPLPDKVASLRGKTGWIREAYPWGSAEVFYAPGPGEATMVSAALPVPTLWGDVLGFLRVFLLGTLATAMVFLVYGLGRSARTGRWEFHRRLKYRLVASFALISIIPIFLLGSYTESETVERIRDMRAKLSDAEPGLTADKLEGAMDSKDLRKKAESLGGEWDVYLPGTDETRPHLRFTSRREAVDCQLIPTRLPGSVYENLVLGGDVYRFEREVSGPWLAIRGYRRLLDRDLQTIGVLSNARFQPAWMMEATISREVSLILALYLLSLIAVGFFALFLARRIALPLEKLTEATRAVALGDLEHRVHLDAADEIGDLVDSFNTMTAQLKSGREALIRAEKESAWREMARQIAHEIKNPLTPMSLSAQHILRAHRDRSEKFDGILEKGLARITDQVEALRRIAEEFSDFARFPDRDMKPMDLNPLIHEAVQLIAEEGLDERPEKAIRFEEKYEESLPPVTADVDEIRRVMINLLRNAVQALADSGGSVTVSTGLSGRAAGSAKKKKGKTRVYGAGRKIPKEKAVAEIRIADNGPGIPDGLQDKLFQPYFSTKSGGTGLGLAICKKALDELGGEIEIESEEGAGTTVLVRLPLTPPVAPGGEEEGGGGKQQMGKEK